MPVYLFTFHAYGSWLPDREQGYVRRDQGVLRQDNEQANRYKRQMKQDAIIFDDYVQELLMETFHRRVELKGYDKFGFASDPSHVHFVVGWSGAEDWSKVRYGFKYSFTKTLNTEIEKKIWFSRSGSRKQVTDQVHLDYLLTQYLPSHRGVGWIDKRWG